MDIQGMIASLRLELNQIDEAILNLERLAIGGGKRRGRPPKWMATAKMPTEIDVKAPAKKSKKRVVSAEARKKMAEAQRRRWAAARGGAAEA